jgi:hypothetical protein
MSTINGTQNNLSLPLVIGVTGHRDLRPEDRGQLEASVRQIIEKLAADFPHTPLILLSSLAEGADRLVAEVALDLGLELIVPLPMSREIYATDFSTAASREEFESLLQKARQWFELPIMKGTTQEEVKARGPARNIQYEQAGVYVVRHSHLLIALWDGVESHSVGGTCEVIKFQLEGVPQSYAPGASAIDSPETGPVYHILTPRRSESKLASEPFQLRTLLPKGYSGEADRFGLICTRTDEFNRDIMAQTSALTDGLESSRERLFPQAEISRLPSMHQLRREQFALADVLAKRFQNLTQRTLKELFILVLLAAIAFDLYADVFPLKHWIIAAYVALVAVAYLWFGRRAERKNYQNKYQDYRALAEGMRVQFFWGLAQLDASVDDHYLRKQRSELDWICSAIRAWNLPPIVSEKPNNAEKNDAGNLADVLKHWIEDQSRYFSHAAEREDRRLKKFEPYIRWLLRFGLGVALLMALGLLLPHPWKEQLHVFLHKHHAVRGGLLTLVSLLPIGAALLHAFAEKAALSEHAKRYGRMSVLFANAKQRITAMLGRSEFAEARVLIEELGREALAENGDWVILHRERPLEVPHAG